MYYKENVTHYELTLCYGYTNHDKSRNEEGIKCLYVREHLNSYEDCINAILAKGLTGKDFSRVHHVGGHHNLLMYTSLAHAKEGADELLFVEITPPYLKRFYIKEA